MPARVSSPRGRRRRVHPLTGRQIAGIATDTNWLDRATREQEEAPEQALTAHWDSTRNGRRRRGGGHRLHDHTPRSTRRFRPGRSTPTISSLECCKSFRTRHESSISSNVEVVQGTETDARLPDNAIDLALLVDVYHELWHPQEMLRSIRRSLKPNGELVLVEYRKEDPSIPIADTHRMSVAEARTEVEAEGFTFDRLVPGLPRQHIIVFRKAASPDSEAAK